VEIGKVTDERFGIVNSYREDVLEEGRIELNAAMLEDKTGSALAIFESETQIVMPDYIRDVVNSC